VHLDRGDYIAHMTKFLHEVGFVHQAAEPAETEELAEAG